MTYQVGQTITVSDTVGVALRGQVATIKFVDNQGNGTRYFCVTRSGKDGWVAERHINTDSTQEALVPLNDLAEAVSLAPDSLRHAAYVGRLKAVRENGKWYSTMQSVREYLEIRQFSKVRGNAKGRRA